MRQWYDDDSHEAQAYTRVSYIAYWLISIFVVDRSILQVMQAEGHHKAHLSHELIAAAASYEVCNPLDHSILCLIFSSFRP